MTTISIKDLPESVALDREAMLAITGGARSGVSSNFSGRSMSGSERVIVYPPGFTGFTAPKVGEQPSLSKHFK